MPAAALDLLSLDGLDLDAVPLVLAALRPEFLSALLLPDLAAEALPEALAAPDWVLFSDFDPEVLPAERPEPDAVADGVEPWAAPLVLSSRPEGFCFALSRASGESPVLDWGDAVELLLEAESLPEALLLLAPLALGWPLLDVWLLSPGAPLLAPEEALSRCSAGLEAWLSEAAFERFEPGCAAGF